VHEVVAAVGKYAGIVAALEEIAKRMLRQFTLSGRLSKRNCASFQTTHFRLLKTTNGSTTDSAATRQSQYAAGSIP
jgi:hypothetical protein